MKINLRFFKPIQLYAVKFQVCKQNKKYTRQMCNINLRKYVSTISGVFSNLWRVSLDSSPRTPIQGLRSLFLDPPPIPSNLDIEDLKNFRRYLKTQVLIYGRLGELEEPDLCSLELQCFERMRCLLVSLSVCPWFGWETSIYSCSKR